MKKFLKQNWDELISLSSVTTHQEINAEKINISLYACNENKLIVTVKENFATIISAELSFAGNEVVIYDNDSNYIYTFSKPKDISNTPWLRSDLKSEDFHDILEDALKLLLSKIDTNVIEETSLEEKETRKKNKLNKIKNTIKSKI